MDVSLIFIFYLLCFGGRHWCYQIRVTITEDGRTETAHFDVTEDEIPTFDVPPSKSRNVFQQTFPNLAKQKETFYWDSFNGSTKNHSESLRRGKAGNATVKFRKRRFVPDKWCNTTESVHKAITVTKDDFVHLPCHSCMDESNDLYESLQWVKLHPNPDRNNLYLLKEVVSDMHDDEKRNNIVINLKHTLIIRKAKKSHSGSYICKPETEREFEKLRMTWQEMQKWIVEDSHMRFFYHLDVVDFDKIPTVETGAVSGTPTLEPFEMKHENVLIYSKWLPWSSCSVCDQRGMRQRIGLCVIKKLDSDRPVPHAYLNNVLQFAGHDLPCKSEFLKEFDGRGWLDRPNEIQFEECFEKCPQTSTRRKRHTISVKEMSQITDKVTKNKEIKKIKVDKYLILKCPGSTLFKKPVWKIGSKMISQIEVRKLTNKRVNFDIFGSMHFMKVKLHDSGVYSCWIDKKLKKKFHVRVKENQLKDIVRYGKYLGLVLVADFIIFLILSSIKYCHRLIQVRRKSKT